MKNRVIILMFSLFAAANADTLTLRDGTKVVGKWQGANTGYVQFLVADQVKTYARVQVAEVTFQSMPDIAPPPPPPAEISLGMPADQVVAILGQPKSVVDMGEKKIYVYPNIKVTFVSGKMTTAE